MEKILDVWLLGMRAGQLSQDINSQLTFQYNHAYLDNPGNIPLSHSMPLRPEPYIHRECRGFFSGLLPEGEVRTTVARNLGISARNDFSLLSAIGGECAGAVSFTSPDIKIPYGENQYQDITEDELALLIKSLPERPLLAGKVGIRLSLAGAQEKLALAIREQAFAIPIGTAPSTHIIKPDLARFPGIIYNEALCMQLARNIGLTTAEVDIRYARDIPYLCITRYDRIQDQGHGISRLHQEDFCQALGIVSDRKYQQEGGPSLVDCFNLIREISSVSAIDLQQLLDGVIFNYCIGNNDAHAKNFSLLYTTSESGRQQIRLAPLYDLISTTYYPVLSAHMAMAIGDKYISSEVLSLHFEQLAKRAGLTPTLVIARVKTIAGLILEHLPDVTSQRSAVGDLKQYLTERVKEVIRKMR
jgi:serine/threonine-protein kinase HipA